MTTGPAHWECLIRGRAVDNQLFVAAISPARDASASYVAWGNSTVVNPWLVISFVLLIHCILIIRTLECKECTHTFFEIIYPCCNTEYS